MTSYGAISIILVALFIISVGIQTLSTTNLQVLVAPGASKLSGSTMELDNNMREVFMFKNNFTPLAGVLGVGYFLHPVSVPIIRNNKIQANNERDLFWGYTLVFLSYTIIGISGYIGFSGVYFADYAKTATGDNRPIAQNCTQMFALTSVAAFFLRLIVLNLVFNSYPILNFFFRAGLIKLYREFSRDKTRDTEGERPEVNQMVDAWAFNILTIAIQCIPLGFSIFYPKIASILGYVGSVCGLVVIYFLPVCTYLTKLKHECDNPILAAANNVNRQFQHKKLY